jgi:hypothetical protein
VGRNNLQNVRKAGGAGLIVRSPDEASGSWPDDYLAICANMALMEFASGGDAVLAWLAPRDAISIPAGPERGWDLGFRLHRCFRIECKQRQSQIRCGRELASRTCRLPWYTPTPKVDGLLDADSKTTSKKTK